MDYHITLLATMLWIAIIFLGICWEIFSAFEIGKKDRKETISKQHRKDFGI